MSATGATGPAYSGPTGARATGVRRPDPVMRVPIVRGESETVGPAPWSVWLKLLWGLAAFCVVAAVVATLAYFVGDGPDRHRREIRYIGDLECVYDPHEARVEACVRASR